eukprot:TRINITY_DN101008_c0_g1_i1.p1 TRINITY_DN101008_c0_g1~~TRINITY_DN101008_c0_g1_i1.p1  ORF type:complete len:206 (+),score=56.31 TRINITY_DN101008_c0_g1_i1:123-740(+)
MNAVVLDPVLFHAPLPISTIIEVTVEIVVVFAFVFACVASRPSYQKYRDAKRQQKLKELAADSDGEDTCSTSAKESDDDLPTVAPKPSLVEEPDIQDENDEDENAVLQGMEWTTIYTDELLEAVQRKLSTLTPESIEDSFARVETYSSTSSEYDESEDIKDTKDPSPVNRADWDAVGGRISDMFACFADDDSTASEAGGCGSDQE